MFFNISVLDDYDHRYVSSVNIKSIPAFRVEQAEYIVTNINNAIGTYNIHQCVVLYIRNVPAAIHGLAHVDGHIEINSLSPFLEYFFFSSDNEIKIFLDSKSDVSGLNDPNLNFYKVVSLLKNTNYEVIDEAFPDFVIDHKGNRIKGLPNDKDNLECRALHVVQQAKRAFGYLGTYPIIQGCSDKYSDVILDQRAFFILNKYTQNPQSFIPKDELAIGGGVAEGNQAFIESLEYLNTVQNTSSEILKGCFGLSVDFLTLTSRYNVPIVIPENSNCDKNVKLFSCLQTENEVCVKKLRKVTGTIKHVLDIAHKHDNALNVTGILKYLSKITNIDSNFIGEHQYDTIVTVEQINFALKEVKSPLYSYIVVNSKGHLSFAPHSVTLEFVLEAIKFIDQNNILTYATHCFVDEHNTKVQSKMVDVNLEQYAKDLYSVTIRIHDELKDFLSEKQIRRMKFFATQSETVTDFFEKIEEKVIAQEETFSRFKKTITEKLEILVHEKFISELYTKDIPYSILQSDFLKFIEPFHLKDFDELTISKTIAFPSYDEKTQIYEIPNLIAFKETIATHTSSQCNNLSEEITATHLKSLVTHYILHQDLPLPDSFNAICFNQESIYMLCNFEKHYLKFNLSKDVGNLLTDLADLYQSTFTCDFSSHNPKRCNLLDTTEDYCCMLS